MRSAGLPVEAKLAACSTLTRRPRGMRPGWYVCQAAAGWAGGALEVPAELIKGLRGIARGGAGVGFSPDEGGKGSPAKGALGGRVGAGTGVGAGAGAGVTAATSVPFSRWMGGGGRTGSARGTLVEASVSVSSTGSARGASRDSSGVAVGTTTMAVAVSVSGGVETGGGVGVNSATGMGVVVGTGAILGISAVVERTGIVLVLAVCGLSPSR